MRRSDGQGQRLSTLTRLPLVGPLLLAPPLGFTTHCHLSVHSLALPCPGSGDDSRGSGTGTGAPGGGSLGGRRCTSGNANLSEGEGDAMSAPSLAVSAGHGADVACLNAF